MKLNKKKVFTLAIAVCLVATLSLGSLAWFTDTDSVTNDFFIAGSEDENPDDIFSIDVWEDATEDDPTGEGKIQDGIEFENILPGDELFKEVHIENTGSYDQFIRATVTVTGASIWQDVYDEYVVPLDVLTNADLSGVHTMVSYYDVETDSFVYELYYTEILPVDGDMVIFDTVNIPEMLDRFQAAALQSFEIGVVADAVQTENVGDNVYEAFETVGLVETFAVTDVSGLAAALAAEGEARIVLDPSVDWSANAVVVNYAISNKTIDFNGQNGTIEFASGATAENVVVTGIVDTDGAVNSVKTAADVTGDITITNSTFVDKVGAPNGAIVLAGGDITIDGCEFIGTGKGYGIYNSGVLNGSLTIKNSTFENFGSWAIQINNAVNGDVLIDNCTFNTPDGVLKVLYGVNGDFTFVNNTLIGCKGHDGAGMNALIVSSSAKYNPLTATGTITYENNKYLVAEDEEPAEVVADPIVGDSEGDTYDGELFDGLTDALVVKSQVLMGNANIKVERTYKTVVLENVIAATEGNLITATASNTIILHDCDITLEKGAKLIVGDGVVIPQVMMHNVTVNGVLLTQENVAQYLEGVNWCQVW